MSDTTFDPENEWHMFLWIMLSWVTCEGCGYEPSLQQFFPDNSGGEDAADEFAVAAAEFLQREGWQLIDQIPYCPSCTAKSVS